MAKAEDIEKNLECNGDILEIKNIGALGEFNISCNIRDLKRIKKNISGLKSTIHGKKFATFKKLVDDCIGKSKGYKTDILPYIKGEKDHTLQEYFEKLKGMEGTDESKISDPELFLNLQIQKEINRFRKIKDSLTKRLDGLRNDLGKVRSFDIIKRLKKMDVIGSINSAEKALENFQGARKSIKLRARKDEKNGVVTYSTFVHSIFNYKNVGNLIYRTGMVGSLFDVTKYIKRIAGNSITAEYCMKNIDKKEMIKMQELLNGSKSYESSKKAFLTGINLCNKLFKKDSNNQNATGIDSKAMIQAIKDVKNEINTAWSGQLKELEDATTTVRVEKSVDRMRGEIESLVDRVVGNHIEKFGVKKEGNSPLKEQLKTFTEIYYQSKSLVIFKQSERLGATQSMWTKVWIGVYCITQGIGFMVVFPPLGSFLIGFGTGLLINAVISMFDKSEFESNEALFSRIEQEMEAEEEKEKLKANTPPKPSLRPRANSVATPPKLPPRPPAQPPAQQKPTPPVTPQAETQTEKKPWYKRLKDKMSRKGKKTKKP